MGVFKKILVLFTAVLTAFACIGITPAFAQEDTGIVSISISDSSGMPLSGIDFTLTSQTGGFMVCGYGSQGIYSYDPSGQSTFTSNSGVIRIDDIPAGYYTVSYANNDSSYEFVDNTVSVSAGGVASVSMTAENTTGSLSVRLTGEGGEALQGVTFRISAGTYNLRFVNNGNGFSQYSSGSDTLTTDSSGSIYIDSIESGNYTLVQTGYPYGYNTGLVSEPFSISAGSSTTLNVSNGREYGTVVITANDSAGNDVKETVMMYLYGMPISVFQSANGYDYTDTGAGITEIPISGKTTISNLPYGEYNIHVSSIEEGYDAPQDAYLAVNSTSTQYLTMTSEALDVDTVIKVTDSTSAPADGFKVKIVDKDGETVGFREGRSGEYAYSENGTVEELVVASDGTLKITGLPEGEYEIVEVSSSGFKYNKEKKSFTITKGKGATVNFNAERSIATLAIRSNGKLKAENIAIKLLNKADKVVFEGKTDKDGRIELEGVEDGDYKYVIDEMPNGFINKKYNGSITVDSESKSSINVDVDETYIRVKAPAKGDTVILTNTKSKKEIKGIADSNGTVTFIDLLDGEYAITIGDSTELITIDREYKGEDVDMTDGASPTETIQPTETAAPQEPKPNMLSRLKNSKFLVIIIAVLGFIMLALLGLLFFIKNKDKKAEEEAAEKKKQVDDSLRNLVSEENVEEEPQREGPLFIDVDQETGLQEDDDITEDEEEYEEDDDTDDDDNDDEEDEESVIEETPEEPKEKSVEQKIKEEVKEEPVVEEEEEESLIPDTPLGRFKLMDELILSDDYEEIEEEDEPVEKKIPLEEKKSYIEEDDFPKLEENNDSDKETPLEEDDELFFDTTTEKEEDSEKEPSVEPVAEEKPKIIEQQNTFTPSKIIRPFGDFDKSEDKKEDNEEENDLSAFVNDVVSDNDKIEDDADSTDVEDIVSELTADNKDIEETPVKKETSEEKAKSFIDEINSDNFTFDKDDEDDNPTEISSSDTAAFDLDSLVAQLTSDVSSPNMTASSIEPADDNTNVFDHNNESSAINVDDKVKSSMFTQGTTEESFADDKKDDLQEIDNMIDDMFSQLHKDDEE